jgi:hypothetical protein
MRLIRALVFVGHGVAPAGTGSTPKRTRLGLAVADELAVAWAAVPAELGAVVTGWVVVDAELPAEHPTSKAAAPRETV